MLRMRNQSRIERLILIHVLMVIMIQTKSYQTKYTKYTINQM